MRSLLVAVLFALAPCCATAQPRNAVSQVASADNTTDASTLYQLGLQYALQGQDDKAASAFRRSIDLDPNRFEAYKALDDVLSKHNDWNAIIQSWNRFIQLNPDSAQAYCERGGAHSRKHERALAQADGEQSCRLGFQECCRITGRTQAELLASSRPSATAHPGRSANSELWYFLLFSSPFTVWFIYLFSKPYLPARDRNPLAGLCFGSVEVWSPPPELQSPLPRDVKYRLGMIVWKSLFLFLGASACLFSCGIDAIAWNDIGRPGFEWLYVIVLLTPASFFLLWKAIRLGSSEKYALKWGTAVAARLTDVHNLIPLRSNQQLRSITRYEFKDASGNVIAGRTNWWNLIAETGLVVTVVYDPKNPSHRHSLYPSTDFKLARPEETANLLSRQKGAS